MAPEQAKDPRRVDFRADVYALGITLQQALTGIGPRGPRVDVSTPARLIPPALAPLLRRMIAPHPGDRFTSYDSLLSALRQADQSLQQT
jgi:serine/threonine protein kinase